MKKTCSIVFDDMFNNANIEKPLNKQTRATEQSWSMPSYQFHLNFSELLFRQLLQSQVNK